MRGPLRGGVLAAGEGRRLEAFGVPKPLVMVGGKTLIARTLELLAEAGCDPVALIVNEEGRAVAEHARGLGLPFTLDTLVQSTPSSLHSLHALAERLRGPERAGRFVLCTVDSIVQPAELLGFVRRFAEAPATWDLLLTYTDFVDDESPLRIGLRDDGRDGASEVTAIGIAAATSPFVTVGAYGMSARVLDLAAELVQAGETRLRTLLARAIERGFVVHGHRLGKAIDVDRPQDVQEAERFLAGEGNA